MKIRATLLLLFTLILSLNAQEKKTNQDTKSVIIRCGNSVVNNDINPLYILDGVPIDKSAFLKTSPKDITSVTVLKDKDAVSFYGASAINGVVLLETNTMTKAKEQQPKTYPFKVYTIANKHWVRHQDIYNDLLARVPSLRIGNRNDITASPNFNIRGSDVTIVIVDGIRYDASILNSLNPADIESIKVAPSVAATNYFRNGFITN